MRGIVESTKEMSLALNSQTNGRKQNRYKTSQDSCNPALPKRSFRRHFKAILKPNSAWQPRIYKRQFHSGSTRIRVPTCFSSKQNGSHLYEMHEGDIIFSANQGDSSMEDKDLQAKEI